jgi:hypothetical protein
MQVTACKARLAAVGAPSQIVPPRKRPSTSRCSSVSMKKSTSMCAAKIAGSIRATAQLEITAEILRNASRTRRHKEEYHADGRGRHDIYRASVREVSGTEGAVIRERLDDDVAQRGGNRCDRQPEQRQQAIHICT